MGKSQDELYDDAIDSEMEHIHDEILSDKEASTVVMEVALKLSHRFDKDQDMVASDIDAAFKYKHGEEPSDWAATIRENAMRR
jgi:hypothetical protein